jgi:NADPH:quinone reductase-like Zn-dependent oxidoreductase
MQAARIHSFGSADVLYIDEVPIPQPQRDEVLIKVRAVSVNPVDYKIREGDIPNVTQEQLPVTLGRDVAGTVARCGDEVSGYRPGDAVYALLDGKHGGYAEYVIVKERDLARKPERLDYREAAAVPLAAITAWQGLFDHAGLKAGQHVLIHGGAGGVGHFAIQLAKEKGATVSTTVSSDDVDFAHELGADRAVDYEHERFESRVRGVDVVLDLVGGDTQERSWQVLKEGGAMVSTTSQPSTEMARSRRAIAELYFSKPNAGELAAIGELIDARKVAPHVHAVYPLSSVREAQVELEQGHVRGKIVLDVAEA